MTDNFQNPNKQSSFSKILYALIFILLSGNLYCQNYRKHYLGLHVANGASVYNPGDTYKPGSSYEDDFSGQKFLSFGLRYSVMSSKNLETGTGLIVSFTHYNYRLNYSWNNRSYDSSDQMYILSVPFSLKYHFLKYLYLNGNVSALYTSHKEYSYGAGLGAGLGAVYTFRNGLALSIEPCVKWNYLLDKGEFSFSPDMIRHLGVEMGVGYRF